MTIRSDMSNPRKKQTWEHSLEDVEENKGDATTSTMSGFDIMAKFEESAKQPNQRHEQNGSSSSGRDGCLQTERTLMKGSREAGGREQRDACVQTMATSETGAVHDKSGWCFVETSISTGIFERLVNTSSEVSNEEYVLAVVTDDQEGEDATTTDSDGDVSPKWLKVCKKRSKKKAMRTEDQETLDLNAGHKVNEEKITIKGHAPKRVREWRIRELVRSSGQRIEDTARRSRSRRRRGPRSRRPSDSRT